VSAFHKMPSNSITGSCGQQRARAFGLGCRPFSPSAHRMGDRIVSRVPSATRVRHLDGGRTWWAHLQFTRINITPTILPKKIEDLREAGATSLDTKPFDGGLT
jgi:hypothetical protein